MIIFHHNHQSIQITKVNNINKPEDAIAMANSQPSYEEFTPISDFISEKECDSLLIYLPGKCTNNPFGCYYMVVIGIICSVNFHKYIISSP